MKIWDKVGIGLASPGHAADYATWPEAHATWVSEDKEAGLNISCSQTQKKGIFCIEAYVFT